MTVKIDQRIRSFQVVAPGQPPCDAPAAAPVQLDESLQRPEQLSGTTYKIKSPRLEHALYVTINDILLNADTPFEQRRPFEIFINSKNMDHFQWIAALTGIMSAVLRKGGDCTFLVGELKAVSDPRGGYQKKGGVYMPSIVAEIGVVLEHHLIAIGLLHPPLPSAAQPRHLAERRATWEASQGAAALEPGEGFPPGAQRCGQCHTQAVVTLEDCATCLNCGHSQCG